MGWGAKKCNYLMEGEKNIPSWKYVIKTLCLATNHVNISAESLSSYAGMLPLTDIVSF